MQNEGVATKRITDVIELCRNILIALGAPPSGPTRVSSDNRSNVLISTAAGSPGRCRHALRRYQIIQERVKSGTVTISHVPDVENPADFLTKWVKREKLHKSLDYLTNAHARRAHPG